MGITATWDIATPLGAEDPKNGDNRIVEAKTSLKEIFQNGGHYIVAGPSSDLKLGRHVCGQELASGGAGTPLAGEFYVYDANGTTRIVTVRDSTAAPANQFDVGTLQYKGTGGLAVTGAAGFGNTTVTGTITATGTIIASAAATVAANLGINGGNTSGITTIGDANYTALATDRVIVWNLNVTNRTLTLPAAAANSGREYFVVCMGAGALGRTLTIDPNGAELINGALNMALVPTLLGEAGVVAVHIICNGTAWYVLGDRRTP
jgi:hypothetical protein